MRRCRTKNWRQLCDVWELEQAAVRVDSSFIHDAHDIGCCVPVSADSGHTIIRQFFPPFSLSRNKNWPNLTTAPLNTLQR